MLTPDQVCLLYDLLCVDACLRYPAQSKTFETREAAEQWARAIERELDIGLYINRGPAEKNTLGDILKRYLDEVVPTHKGAEVEKIRINAILKAKVSQLAMIALTPAALAEWRDERLKAVAPATVRRDLDIISAAINTARKDWGIHMDNPILSMRRPKRSKARERRLILDEETRLLAALDNDERDEHGRLGSGTRNPWIKLLVRLATETAMRRGELLSLTWDNINLGEQTAYLPDTKNGTSRSVPLSMAAVALLRALLRHLSGRVFPVTEDSVKKAFTRALKRAREPEGATEEQMGGAGKGGICRKISDAAAKQIAAHPWHTRSGRIATQYIAYSRISTQAVFRRKLLQQVFALYLVEAELKPCFRSCSALRTPSSMTG